MRASEYKKAAKKKQVIEDVPLPSGAVFKMRTAPIQQWVTTGVLPASLAAKMQVIAGSANGNGDEAAMIKAVVKNFTEADYVAQQQLGRKLLEYCCIEPKVSVDGSDPEALAPEDILPEDFVALMAWIWSGGRQGETLTKFR